MSLLTRGTVFILTVTLTLNVDAADPAGSAERPLTVGECVSLNTAAAPMELCLQRTAFDQTLLPPALCYAVHDGQIVLQACAPTTPNPLSATDRLATERMLEAQIPVPASTADQISDEGQARLEHLEIISLGNRTRAVEAWLIRRDTVPPRYKAPADCTPALKAPRGKPQGASSLGG